MMMKYISVLLTVCLLAGLLAGCILTPESPPIDPTVTAQAEIATEAPETAAPQTDATEQIEPGDTVFELIADESCNRYGNQIVEIVFDKNDGSVICREIETGAEQTLFTLETDNTINLSLIGVTENRLYFGWNEIEDWWGVNVYSLDYQGGDPVDYGSAWEPSFENGWLLLLGFRSDVSPTEMLLIDRDDQIAAEDETGAVWDATVTDGAVYYLCVEDMPADWTADAPEGGCRYDLVRIEPNSDMTVVKVFEGLPSYYSPAFFNGDVICLYETNEYYDLFTLEPTDKPED